MEDKFVYALLGSICLIELFVIILMLCSNSYFKGVLMTLDEDCSELENRALNAESDLTQAQIKIIQQGDKIADLEEIKKLQLTNSIALENRNSLLLEELEALRLEFFELESTYKQ